jgi:quinolinate synthetase A subunit
VGQHGGACCTSSNALEVFRWAMNGPSPLRGDGIGSPQRSTADLSQSSLSTSPVSLLTPGLHPPDASLDTLDNIPCKPVGFVPRDPFPKGHASPNDLTNAPRDRPHLALEQATYFITWKTDAEKSIVLDALTHWDGKRCRVYAATVLSNHVHCIIRPFDGETMSDLTTSIRRFSAKAINTHRNESGHVWDDEPFDHILRSEASFCEKFLYTVRNAVLSGVAMTASSYPWTRVHTETRWLASEPEQRASQRASLRAAIAPEGRRTKVLFLPDQHLGRNTAHRFGIDVARASCVYDPRLRRKGEELGGASPEQLLASDVILWAGHCSVHKLFRPEHCDALRAADAAQGTQTTILVHPECCKEVVDKADMFGSTEHIINTIRAAKPGSKWAIGTEVHLVTRLAREAAQRGVHVRILSDCQCLCTTMYRIDQPHLLWTLDNLSGNLEARTSSTKPAKPRVVNQISVPAKVRELALLAIDRMLELSPNKPAHASSNLSNSARTQALVGVD